MERLKRTEEMILCRKANVGCNNEGTRDPSSAAEMSRRQWGSAVPAGAGVDEEDVEEALDMFSLEQLKHRKAIYIEAVRRMEAAERGEAGDAGSGDEMQGARAQRGRRGRTLSEAEKRKRSLAAEQQVLKLFQRMSNKYGVTAWVFGYTTSIGKPRIGAAESLQPWWVHGNVYESNAIRAHVAGRGELQQEINRLDSVVLDDLLKRLNGPQLHSLAASWLTKCSPSMRDFPLNGEKGSPPWWPRHLNYRKVSLMKNSPLRDVMLAALRNICLEGDSVAATTLKLEGVFTTSKVLSRESAHVRAIVHGVINRATAQWQPQGNAPSAGPNKQGDAVGAQPEGGQGAPDGDVDGAAGAEGIGRRRKRRRRCDITEYPFKCTQPGCEDHRGFVNPGGLANDYKGKHPGVHPGAASGTAAAAASTSEAEDAPDAAAAPAGEEQGPADENCGVPASHPESEEGARGHPSDHQGATTEAGHETVSQQGPTDRPPGYEPAPPGSQERQRGPTGAAPAPATHTRRRAIYPQWKTSQRSGTRKRKAQFEDIRKRVTSALRPSLEGMMHKGGYVFIAHQTGTRVHGCPLRSPSAPRCHRSEMWTGFCWFESR